MNIEDIKGKRRVAIENVSPEINGGRFSAKSVEGEAVTVEADIYGDGHDEVIGLIMYRHENDKNWNEKRMQHIINDRFSGNFITEKQGKYFYTVTGWVDHAITWLKDIKKKIGANQNVRVELLMGANFLKNIKKGASAADKKKIQPFINAFEDENNYEAALKQIDSDELKDLLNKYPVRHDETVYHRTLEIISGRKKELFSAWYEFFPRSASMEPDKHGTFKDCEQLLPRISGMGFDVIYLPPVHPIGKAFRKGKNNSTTAMEGEPGSPWAIGSPKGGHKAIHPELGTMADFKRLIKKAKEQGIEIALDIAFQCSQDHPYVKEHPQWFKWRPDGTVQYAENPPKKYQDVLPINFETDDWKNLWQELKSVFTFWVDKGVKIFRVDNPHTKPFIFWEWLIHEVRKENPEVIFLSEAFTRPKIMDRLGKVGFTQSYTYYTWRNTKHDLIEYMTHLTKSDSRYFFRPNFWPNTPDINPFPLQGGEQSIFYQRFILAATLSSNYGFYGPVFEFMVHQPMPAKEEYFESEKYEIKNWDWSYKNEFMDLIATVNKIRNENEALQTTWNIEFCELHNDMMLAFYKYSQDRKNQLLVVVNLDKNTTQSGWVRLPLEHIKPDGDYNFIMHDLLNGNKYNWNQEWNFVQLDPQMPAHIFRIEQY